MLFFDGGLLFQFSFSGHRLFKFLILPAQKTHRQFFFLLSDKTHNEMPKLPEMSKMPNPPKSVADKNYGILSIFIVTLTSVILMLSVMP
jgi:hypothetical protein